MADQPLVPVLRHVRRLVGPPDERADDAQLLERFALGHDHAAFEALLARHGGLVWRVCRRVLGHTQDAEDAWQATFLVLARRASSIRRGGSLAGWLHSVAYHVADKAKVRAARRQAREQRTVPGVVADPAHEVAWRELGRILEHEVRALPERLRLPVLLCYWQGLTNEEAGRQLGWPAGTVKSRLAKAREVLHGRLTARGVTLPGGVVTLFLSAAGSAEATVPAPLAAATVRAVLADAAGQTGEASAEAAALAEGALRGTTLTTARLVLTLLLALSAAAFGASSLIQPGQGEQPRGEITEARRDGGLPKAKEPRGAGEDIYRDPLPAGVVARLGTTRLRHGGAVTALSFSGDGKLLASWGHDATARFWDAASGKELYHHPAGSALTCAVALIPGPTAVAAIPDGAVVRLWDVAARKELRRLEGHTDPLVNVFFAGRGKWLVSVALGSDRTLRLWDVASGRQLGKFPAHVNGVRSVALSADGGLLAYGAADEEVWVWDVSAGKQLCRVAAAAYLDKVVQFRLTAIALSPDGKFLATGCENHKTRLWDVATGKELAELPGGGLSVAFTPDCGTLAAGGWDGTISLWDVFSRKLRRSLPAAHVGTVQSLAFSPDGKVLASGGGGDGSDRVHRLLFQADCGIRLWDAVSGEELPQSRGPHGAPVAVVFSPDGKLVASASKDGTVRLWYASTGRALRAFRAHEGVVYALAFAPDGKLLASAGQDKAVRLWAVPGGERVRTLMGHQGGVRAVAFAPDGKTLASAGGSDHTVRLWDVAAGKERLLLQGHRAGAYAVAFAPDGCTLASGGGVDVLLPMSETANAVCLWDAVSGREVRRLAGPPGDYAVYALAFAPDGRALASGYRNGPVRVWEMATGGQRLQVETRADGGLAISADGAVLATSTPNFDRTVRLWTTATGEEMGQLRGHLGGVYSVAFAPDGKRLASASEDTTVLLWGMDSLRRPRVAEVTDRAELERLWEQLGDGDAQRGYRAVTALASSLRQAVVLLRERLQPAEAKVDSQQIDRLVADLDGARFGDRQKAMQALEGLGELAEAALRRARAGQELTLEAQRRVDQLLEKLERPYTAGGRLRELRAVEVLERIGTHEARRVLERLAGGAPEARLTREARASLVRQKQP